MNKFKDLFGNPGLDQDCLEKCQTPSECILNGCWRSFKDQAKKTEPDATIDQPLGKV
jgi:hypothetical protein